MRPANTLLTRREFLQASAVATISAPVPASIGLTQVAPQQPNDDVLPARQKERRKELWGLLGDLPWGHKPGPAKLVSKENKETFDEWYIRNASPWVDTKITLMTLRILTRNYLGSAEALADLAQVQAKRSRLAMPESSPPPKTIASIEPASAPRL